MVQHHGAVLAAIEHSVLEERLGFQVLPHQVQDPRERVQVGGVIGFGLYGLPGHGIGLLQFPARLAEVIGVVVQDRGVGGIQLEGLVVAAVGRLAVSLGVIGVPHHGPGAQAQLLLFGKLLQDETGVADDGVIVVQVEVGGVGIIQESQFLEAVESRQGTVPGLFPTLGHDQELDIGGGVGNAFRETFGQGLEPGAGFLRAAGGIEVAGHRAQEGAVGRMQGRGLAGQRIIAVPVQLQDLGVDGLREVPQVHALGFGGGGLRAEEPVQQAEVFCILASVPIGLRHAQDGRDVVAIQGQGLSVAGLGQGIAVFGQIIVSQHGKDGDGGIAGVELLQRLHPFFLAPHGREEVVAGADHFLGGSRAALDPVQFGQGFLPALQLEVDIQEFVGHRLFVGEVFPQGLIEFQAFLGFPLHQAQPRQGIAVPVVAAVQLNRLPEALQGFVGLLQGQFRQAAVIPH